MCGKSRFTVVLGFPAQIVIYILQLYWIGLTDSYTLYVYPTLKHMRLYHSKHAIDCSVHWAIGTISNSSNHHHVMLRQMSTLYWVSLHMTGFQFNSPQEKDCV